MIRAPRKYLSWTISGPVVSENGQALIFFRPALTSFRQDLVYLFLFLSD